MRSFQDVDIKLLRVFRAIVESGGFSAAQAVLNTSASRISTQMSDLESRLGVRLCNRGRIGFSLTEEGKIIYEEGEKLFRAIEDFRLKVSETETQLTGEIRLGLLDNLVTNPADKLPQAISIFKKRKNNVQLDLKIESPLSLETGVIDGRLHLAIGVFFHRIPSLNYRPIMHEKQYLYCSKKHPLFSLTDQEIKKIDLYKYDYANRKQAETEGELASDFGIHGSASSDNMEALSILVLSGAYMAFLPEEYAQFWVESGNMKKILPKKFKQQTTVHLITKKGAQKRRAVEIFIQDLIKTHNSDIQEKIYTKN